MSDKEVNTTTLGSIGTSILVLVMLVIIVVVVIYVIQSVKVPSFPLSPFRYEDIVVIRPAILTANPNINPDQYLTVSQKYTNPFGCKERYDYGSAAGVQLGYALTLDGKRDNPRSQWVLKQFSSPGDFDSSESVPYGFGNRFYLHNNASPDPKDKKARARFQQLNQNFVGMCYSTTPVVMGAEGGDQQCNWFNMEWLVYFYPTNYPDIYYILFPTCSDETNLQIQPNTGIASIRPWAPNNYTNEKPFFVDPQGQCQQCHDLENVVYNPFVNGIPPTLYQNAIITNLIDPAHPLPPYANANVLLFHITKLN